MHRGLSVITLCGFHIAFFTSLLSIVGLPLLFSYSLNVDRCFGVRCFLSIALLLFSYSLNVDRCFGGRYFLLCPQLSSHQSAGAALLMTVKDAPNVTVRPSLRCFPCRSSGSIVLVILPSGDALTVPLPPSLILKNSINRPLINNRGMGR
jgi:hypothetical protein